MTRISRTAGCVRFALMGSLAVAATAGQAASRGYRTITCPYRGDAELQFVAPPKLGDLPAIDFDYPAKATLFSFRDGHLLLVAMDQEERSRLRIVISAQLNKDSGAYDGQIVVDMGGHQLQLYSGPVSCRVGNSGSGR